MDMADTVGDSEFFRHAVSPAKAKQAEPKDGASDAAQGSDALAQAMAAGFISLSSSRSDASRSFSSSDKPRSVPMSRSVP
eukprot:10093545-Alexandrium_andersonii.AAC.1